jgi:hypothetical protein
MRQRIKDFIRRRNRKMSEQSEFGKGLVICLVKFAEHYHRWSSQKAEYERMREIRPDLFDESDAVEMYFNGASDHLYEIEVPEKCKGTEIDKKVKELQDFGLEIGHGFKHDRKYTETDIEKAHTLCREIALLIDKELGLEAELGQW